MNKDTETALAIESQAPLDEIQQFKAMSASRTQQYNLLMEWIGENLKDGTDYGRIRGCGEKKSLFKPGSEKLPMLFRLRPTFVRDDETWEMFGRPAGLVCYTCQLLKEDGTIAGEGGGAARLDEKKGWSENNCLKMARKRAQVDAVLRTFGLSEIFTQDLEDMGYADSGPLTPEKAPPAPPAPPPTRDSVAAWGPDGKIMQACRRLAAVYPKQAWTAEALYAKAESDLNDPNQKLSADMILQRIQRAAAAFEKGAAK